VKDIQELLDAALIAVSDNRKTDLSIAYSVLAIACELHTIRKQLGAQLQQQGAFNFEEMDWDVAQVRAEEYIKMRKELGLSETEMNKEEQLEFDFNRRK